LRAENARHKLSWRFEIARLQRRRSTTRSSSVVTVFDNKGGREVLTLVVLVILAALWAVVLLPPLLRSRAERANDSIGDFNYRLDVLGRTNGALHMPGARPRVSPGQRAAKRRRDVLRTLLAMVGGFGLLALATNASIVWALFLIVALAFAAFCAMWAWARSIQVERALKVRSMERKSAPDWVLRRAASS
jgi:hypothetical protein